MNTVAIASSKLRDLYARESASIEQEFSVTGEGSVAVARRTSVVDTILLRLWNEAISPDPEGPKNFALILICCSCTPAVALKTTSRTPSAVFPRNCGT
jgi:hypothetical protein